MKKLWIALIVLLTTAFVLAACGKDAEEDVQTDADAEADTEVTDEENDEESEADVTEDASEDTEESTEDETENSQSTSEENAAEASLHDEYMQLLNDTKEKTDDMRENPEDGSTIEMKTIEGDIYDIWDGLLNDIYGDLEEQLSEDEMEDLRKEQREWIEYRDETAKEASLKFEGGTGEQLEYVATENNVTIERCYELVENYMN